LGPQKAADMISAKWWFCSSGQLNSPSKFFLTNWRGATLP
jgi:hypothetical protein